jgi:hypothetical protein
VVGCFGNMGGTYWVIVIRPRLSRTATTVKCYTGNGSSLSVFNRPVHIDISLADDMMSATASAVQTRANTCKHVQTRKACSVDAETLLKRQLTSPNSLFNRAENKRIREKMRCTYEVLVLAALPCVSLILLGAEMTAGVDGRDDSS